MTIQTLTDRCTDLTRIDPALYEPEHPRVLCGEQRTPARQSCALVAPLQHLQAYLSSKPLEVPQRAVESRVP